jgi:large subunit ribosomal protein L10
MSKLVKDLITKELRSRYGNVDSALWIEMLGVNGNATNALRRELHARHIRLEITKTLLLRRAVAGTQFAKLADALEGPAALVTGGDSLVDTAKAIEEWLPKLKGMRVRGALLEGQYLDQAAAIQLSRMPTKRDLQARLAGIILAPGANLAAAILSGRSRVAGCLKSIIEKLEKNEDAATAA